MGISFATEIIPIEAGASGVLRVGKTREAIASGGLFETENLRAGMKRTKDIFSGCPLVPYSWI